MVKLWKNNVKKLIFGNLYGKIKDSLDCIFFILIIIILCLGDFTVYMVTITDIAERAGVAKSTVSNALTGKKYVSEELKRKILTICEEMNYSPNFYASRLSGNRTNIISLFLEESETGVYHSFYTELIESCLKYLSKHGYHLLISYNSDNRTRNSLLQKGKAPVDGAIIMAPMAKDQRILQFESDLVPCVSIGKPDESSNTALLEGA